MDDNSERQPDFWLLDLDANGYLRVVGRAMWKIENGSLQVVGAAFSINFVSSCCFV